MVVERNEDHGEDSGVIVRSAEGKTEALLRLPFQITKDEGQGMVELLELAGDLLCKRRGLTLAELSRIECDLPKGGGPVGQRRR